MKKIFNVFSIFCFVNLVLYSVPNAEAVMLVPYFDITIETGVVGDDSEFTYDLKVYENGLSSLVDEQSLTLSTQNGSTSELVSTAVSPGSIIYLKQSLDPNFELSEPLCLSDNSEVVFELEEAGVIKMIAQPYTSVICHFINTRLNTNNPVLIIPGILSSYLNRNDNEKTELWPNIKGALFGPPGDNYLDELALNQIGQPNLSYPVVLPTDIIRSVGDKDFFVGLIRELQNVGYEEEKDLYIFPYDWRLDIRQSVDKLYSLVLVSLRDKIDKILESTGSQKIDLVAHSMGGLLVKYFVSQYGPDKIGKFIDIATPHLGAPASFKTLLAGDDMGIKFGFLGLNSNKVKAISRNMPALYQLLPSKDYFSSSLPDYGYYFYDVDDLDNDGYKGRLSFEGTNQFLKNTGLNDVLLDNVTKIHDDLDQINLTEQGIDVFNIVGCGVPTLGKIFGLKKESGEEYFEIDYVSGDGTVPERSARSFSSSGEYRVTGSSHAVLPSTPGVKELVADLLVDKIEDFNFSDNKNVSTTSIECKLSDADLLSFHGPVVVDVYDEQNIHAGPTNAGDYEQNLPGIFYELIGDSTYLFLPTENKYNISLSATNSGVFSFRIKKLRGNEIISTAYFPDISLTNASSTFEVNLEGDTPFLIRTDGDQSENILPPVIFSGDSLESLNQSSTTRTTTEQDEVVLFGGSKDKKISRSVNGKSKTKNKLAFIPETASVFKDSLELEIIPMQQPLIVDSFDFQSDRVPDRKNVATTSSNSRTRPQANYASIIVPTPVEDSPWFVFWLTAGTILFIIVSLLIKNILTSKKK